VISSTLWNVDDKELESILSGILKNSVIVGIKIEDNYRNKNNVFRKISKQGEKFRISSQDGLKYIEKNKDSLIKFEFPIAHTINNKVYNLGKGAIYSSNNVIFKKVRVGFIIIIINSIIKTIALWIIFLWFSRRILGVPLNKLIKAVNKIRSDNMEEIEIDFKIKGKHELILLAESFNTMIKRLQTAQNELSRSEAKYRDIFANIPTGIFQTTIDGKILIANPIGAKIFGYDSPANMMIDLDDISHLFVEQQKQKRFKQILQKYHTIKYFETKIYKKNKSIVDISLVADVIFDDENTPSYIELYITDITEKKTSRKTKAGQRNCRGSKQS